MNNSNTITTVKDLIYLLSCAVNDEDPDPEKVAGMDDLAILMMARSHMLSAAVALALKRIMTLSPVWKEEMGKAMRKQALFDIERAKILRRFEEKGIWYLPLKGIVLKRFFPKSWMREMSDNDILCDSQKMEDVKAVMKELGYSCTEFGKSNHDAYEKNPLSFEMHRQLFSKNEAPLFDDYYQTIKSRLIKDSDNRFGYHMTDEDFYIYILCHAYKHYSKSGTGLRSLMDIYVYYKKKEQTLEWDYITKELEKLGISDFEQKMRSLSTKVFSFLPLSDEELKDLMYFVDSNCYGTIDHYIANRLDGDDSEKAKRRYVFKRIFPDEEFLRKYYPRVYRHRALYPLMVIYRPFKGLATKRKKLYREFKGLKEYKRDDK